MIDVESSIEKSLIQSVIIQLINKLDFGFAVFNNALNNLFDYRPNWTL